jgi:hypothetical protein
MSWLCAGGNPTLYIFFGEIVRLIEKGNNAIGDIFFVVGLGDELKKEAMRVIIYRVNVTDHLLSECY